MAHPLDRDNLESHIGIMQRGYPPADPRVGQGAREEGMMEDRAHDRTVRGRKRYLAGYCVCVDCRAENRAELAEKNEQATTTTTTTEDRAAAQAILDNAWWVED